MIPEFAKLAAEILKSMYEHNSRSYAVVGRTDVGPEPITAEQVASDLRVIYNELITERPLAEDLEEENF